MWFCWNAIDLNTELTHILSACTVYTILWLSLIHCTIYELHVKFVQLIENMFGWVFKLLILLGCDVDVVVINTITMLRYSWIYSLSYQTKWHLIWEQYISCSQRGCKRTSEMRTCYCHSWYFNIQTIYYCIAYYPYYIKYDLLFSFIC